MVPRWFSTVGVWTASFVEVEGSLFSTTATVCSASCSTAGSVTFSVVDVDPPILAPRRGPPTWGRRR